MDYINAFWVGGLICALVQILMEKTKMMPGRIMVLLVVTGAVLSALGWYEPFQDFAGAGASVPLLGFGNVLMKGVKEAVQEQGFFILLEKWIICIPYNLYIVLSIDNHFFDYFLDFLSVKRFHIDDTF